MWTVYERPSDYPFWYVARLWYSDAQGAHMTDEIRVSETLEPLRDRFFDEGLTMLKENGPDKSIIEVWL